MSPVAARLDRRRSNRTGPDDSAHCIRGLSDLQPLEVNRGSATSFEFFCVFGVRGGLKCGRGHRRRRFRPPLLVGVRCRGARICRPLDGNRGRDRLDSRNCPGSSPVYFCGRGHHPRRVGALGKEMEGVRASHSLSGPSRPRRTRGRPLLPGLISQGGPRIAARPLLPPLHARHYFFSPNTSLSSHKKSQNFHLEKTKILV